jgi:hypothetical protein
MISSMCAALIGVNSQHGVAAMNTLKLMQPMS